MFGLGRLVVLSLLLAPRWSVGCPSDAGAAHLTEPPRPTELVGVGAAGSLLAGTASGAQLPTPPAAAPQASTTPDAGGTVLVEGKRVPVTDNFLTSFLTALGMILFSELGDKTFLIAAILAMRHSRLVIFLAATLALAVMTAISVVVGRVLPTLLPKWVTQWAAAILFLVFGVLMVKEGLEMADDHLANEYEEVVHELEAEKSYSTLTLDQIESQAVPEDGTPTAPTRSPSERLTGFLGQCLGDVVPPVAIQTFSMVFLAEWGDRSQLATIVLGAAQNPWGVALGAICGHAVCSLIAVVLGRALSAFLSIKSVTVIGGILFVFFGLLTIL